MKWSGWIVFSLVVAFAAALNAAEPRPVSPRVARFSVTPTRYAADDLQTPPATITPHAPVHYRLASWDIWSGTSSGYVYSPGACDYTPPCVDHLWDGYEQRPHRCYGPKMHHCHGRHSCGEVNGCDTCGSASSCGCGGHASLLKRAHGWHFGGRVCGSGCSSCSDIAPSCGFDGKGSPDIGPTPADFPPAPMPEAGGDEPKAAAPVPTLEKTTRGYRMRGFTGPDRALQR